MNIFEELKNFREDRGLHLNSFHLETYLRKDLEEMLELIGYPENYCKAQAKNIALNLLEDRDNYTDQTTLTNNYNSYNRVDALGDRIVYAIEAIEQQAYNAEIVMDEVSKEINSRDGEIVNGKFEKYRTPEAVAKWYKADFFKAKRL